MNQIIDRVMIFILIFGVMLINWLDRADFRDAMTLAKELIATLQDNQISYVSENSVLRKDNAAHLKKNFHAGQSGDPKGKQDPKKGGKE